MATFQEVKAFIDDKIKDNENGEITGSVLNEALTLLLGAIPEGGVTIVDNLDSEDTTAALSANQGRVLKEMIVQSGGSSTDVDIFPSEYSEEFNNDFTI